MPAEAAEGPGESGCKSERIAPMGWVTAGHGMVEEEVRCETCRTVFVIAQASKV